MNHSHYISEFNETTISYQLESPTVPLNDVYFPSVALCNMNILRKSFITSLMTDPFLMNITNYDELFHLVDEHFIRGIKADLTTNEEIIKEGEFCIGFQI